MNNDALEIIYLTKHLPRLGVNQKPLDVQSNVLPFEISKHVAATCMSFHDSDMIVLIPQIIQ